MSLIKDTEKYINDILIDLGYEYDAKLISSSMPNLGQFQLNIAMPLAKVYHKDPRDIANEIISKFDDRFINVNIAGPGFINLTFSDDVIINYMNSLLDDFNNHIDKVESKKIILDYGGANAAKVLHVGHMRSANIGEAIRRLFILFGNEVISDVHLGDLGRQSGMLISQLMIEKPNLVFFKEDYDGEYPIVSLTADDLGRMYPLASKIANSDPERMEKVRKITAEVESGRRGYLELWRQMVKISSEKIKSTYSRLNCHFDLWKGEMDSLNYIEDTLKVLEPYMYLSDGAKVIDIKEDGDKKEYPPLMVLKSDGSSKYETRDLATIYERMKDYNPDRICYVIDTRQSFNFLQVFRGCYKSGLVPKTTDLCLYDFGTINGPDGRPFKTRDGGVMELDTLLDIVKSEIYKHIKDNLLVEEKEDIAEKLTIATIKYADLLPYRKTDYIFDPIKFSEFNGKTGPYIMYTLVRCKGILKNNNKIDYNIDMIDDYTKDIYIKIISLSSELSKAYNSVSPNIICEFLYDLCNLYNKFYNDVNISNQDNISIKNNYLSMTELVKNTISNLLGILAIDEVEKM